MLKIERNRRKEENLKKTLNYYPGVKNLQLDNPQLDNPIQLSIIESSIKESSNNQSFPSGFPLSINGNDLNEGLNYTELDSLIYKNIDYEVCKHKMLSNPLFKNSIDEYEEIVSILVDVVNHPRKTIKIAGTDFPWKTVQSVFLKLDYSHLEFVMDSLAQNTTNIVNMKAYIISCLYNSTQTISNYYRSKVNHNMPWMTKNDEVLR